MVKNMVSPLQHKVYEYIREYIYEHHYSPTLEEIACGIGISPRSVSLISRSIQALTDAGLVTANKKGYRNIQLVEQAGYSLPLLGRIAAGIPIEAITEPQMIDIGSLFQNDKHFVLEVKGDSMMDEGILDGDFIICKSTQKANEGEIVVALIDKTDTTLKRISFQIKDKITLIPANAKLKPWAYSPERIQIQGIFAGLLRLKK